MFKFEINVTKNYLSSDWLFITRFSIILLQLLQFFMLYFSLFWNKHFKAIFCFYHQPHGFFTICTQKLAKPFNPNENHICTRDQTLTRPISVNCTFNGEKKRSKENLAIPGSTWICQNSTKNLHPHPNSYYTQLEYRTPLCIN